MKIAFIIAHKRNKVVVLFARVRLATLHFLGLGYPLSLCNQNCTAKNMFLLGLKRLHSFLLLLEK